MGLVCSCCCHSLRMCSCLTMECLFIRRACVLQLMAALLVALLARQAGCLCAHMWVVAAKLQRASFTFTVNMLCSSLVTHCGTPTTGC